MDNEKFARIQDQYLKANNKEGELQSVLYLASCARYVEQDDKDALENYNQLLDDILCDLTGLQARNASAALIANIRIHEANMPVTVFTRMLQELHDVVVRYEDEQGEYLAKE